MTNIEDFCEDVDKRFMQQLFNSLKGGVCVIVHLRHTSVLTPGGRTTYGPLISCLLNTLSHTAVCFHLATVLFSS